MSQVNASEKFYLVVWVHLYYEDTCPVDGLQGE
jgi:hypothetical protein